MPNQTKPTASRCDAHLKALYRIKGNLQDICENAFPNMGKKRLGRMRALVILLNEQCQLSEAEVHAAKNAQAHQATAERRGGGYRGRRSA